jgi:hypothetical protein
MISRWAAMLVRVSIPVGGRRIRGTTNWGFSTCRDHPSGPSELHLFRLAALISERHHPHRTPTGSGGERSESCGVAGNAEHRGFQHRQEPIRVAYKTAAAEHDPAPNPCPICAQSVPNPCPVMGTHVHAYATHRVGRRMSARVCPGSAVHGESTRHWFDPSIAHPYSRRSEAIFETITGFRAQYEPNVFRRHHR